LTCNSGMINILKHDFMEITTVKICFSAPEFVTDNKKST